MMRRLLPFLLALFLAGPAAARDLIVAPGAGQEGYPSIGAALKAAAGGDRVLLAEGSYGAVAIRRARFKTPVVIAPQPGAVVHASSIHIRDSAGLTLRGLNVWPTAPGTRGKLVHAVGDTARIRIEGMDLRGAPDAPDSYMTWTLDDWTNAWAPGGIYLDGADSAAIGNSLTGVGFGITTSGPRAEVRGNLIRGFSGDGMRGLGDGSVFAQNRVQDAVKVSKNHDDGFQSWARDRDAGGRKVVSGITLENNVIIEWTGPADHPLRGTLQGIGLFDGIYKDFVIRNNLILISAWHGISLYGAENATVVNNTVLAPGGAPGDRPWIQVGASKRGDDPGGNVVANNLAMKYRKIPGAQKRNVVARYPAQLLRDPAGGDFRPIPGGPIAGTADPAVAPESDLLGRTRRAGTGPDFGALEAD